jgi:hypothetical protein
VTAARDAARAQQIAKQWPRGAEHLAAEIARALAEVRAETPLFSVSDLMGDQAEDSDTVAAITAIVREADHAFETSGGSSRHWVRDQFLPRLNAHGWRVLSPLAHPAPERREEQG